MAQDSYQHALESDLESSLILQETARLALSSLEPEVLAQRVVEDMRERFALASCNVWMLGANRDRIVQVAQVGFPETVSPVELSAESDAARSVRSGETVVRENTNTPDVPLMTRRVLDRLGPEPKSMVILPLAAEEGVFGCLILVWPEPHAFTSADIGMLESMAAGLGLGLRNARLNAAVSAESSLMRGVNRILESGLVAGSEQQLGETCLAVADELTESEFGFIGEVREDGTMSTIAISDPGWEACSVAEPRVHRQGPGRLGMTGLYGEVFRTGRPVRTNEPTDHPASVGTPEGHPPLKSFLGVPLRRKGEVVGVLGVANRPGGYSAQEQRALESLAPAVSTAVYSRRAAQTLSRSTQLLAAHVENSPLAVVEFDPEFRVIRWSDEAEKMFGYTKDEILGKAISDVRWVYEEDEPIVAEQVRGFVDGTGARGKSVNRDYRKDGTVIWCEWYNSATYDSQGRLASVLSLVLDITDRKRLEDALRESERRANDLIRYAPTGIFEIDLLQQRFTVVNDAMSEMSGYSREELLSMDPRELLREDSGRLLQSRIRTMLEGGVPYPDVEYRVRRKDGETIFVLLNVQLTRGCDGTVTRALVIAHDVTERRRIEDERARMLEEERTNARFHEALTRIDGLAHGTLDREEAFERVVTEAARVLGADSAAVAVRDGGKWALRHVYGMPESALSVEVPPEEAPLAELAARTGQSIAVSDVAADPRAAGSTFGRLGSAAAMMLTPVIVRNATVAVVLLNYEHRHTFSEQERSFAARLAASLGLAIANIELYESERDVAETLQETLVVVPSRVPGIEYSRSYRSATSEKGRVGGDFIDVFEAHDDSVGISLGDVSGKGIDAAVTTSLIRTTLRVHALDDQAPAQVARKANDVMRKSTESDTFVTLWFGLLNTKTGQLRYVCAGHPPALVVSPGGEIRELECRDAILGAFDETAYFECQNVLSAGDRLVLYSDGATEARSPSGKFLDPEGLYEVVRRHAAEPTSRLADSIMDEIISFSAGLLRDDAAVLVVEAVHLG